MAQLTNSELAERLGETIDGWKGFVTENLQWLTSEDQTVSITHPFTEETITTPTRHWLVSEFDSIFGETSERFQTVEQWVEDFGNYEITIVGYKNQAEAARDAAVAAQNNSQDARDTTLGYRNEAEGFRDNAEAFRDQAEDFRDGADTFQQDAAGFAADASDFADDAEDSQIAAEAAALDAEGFKQDAESAKTAAETAESNASSSAAAALQSEQNAAASETAASTSETNASTSESNALTYRNEAEAFRDTAQSASDDSINLVETLQVQAITISAGSNAQAAWDSENTRITFSVPEGPQGPVGTLENFSLDGGLFTDVYDTFTYDAGTFA